jgi:serine-type D-Ala-D-Ala carboxypeptidase/endopeptidase
MITSFLKHNSFIFLNQNLNLMLLKKAFAIIVFTTLFLIGCKKNDLIVPQSTDFINPLSTEQDKAVHKLFEAYKDQINTVGMTIGILKNDTTAFYGYGEMERGKGEVPKANTFFEIGSITKVFTAIAVVDFLKSRQLTIDEPIQKFLPNTIKKLEKDGQEITFKHLMTHTSGLPYMPDNLGVFKILFNIDKAWRQYDTTKLYACLKDIKLESKPFTAWNYSNLAIGTLGTILERSTQKQYADIIKEKITQPLGLSDTKQKLSADDLKRMAKGYHGSKEIDYWDDLNAMDGAGVLRSTTADLLKFAQANIDIPNLPIGKAMADCQKEVFKGKIKDTDNDMSMNLGWLNLKLDGIEEKPLFHNGGTGGFSTNLFVFREQKAALVVFFNSVAHNEKEEKARQEFMQAITKTVVR